jgi:hypothetical protein
VASYLCVEPNVKKLKNKTRNKTWNKQDLAEENLRKQTNLTGRNNNSNNNGNSNNNNKAG